MNMIAVSLLHMLINASPGNAGLSAKPVSPFKITLRSSQRAGYNSTGETILTARDDSR
jgi:hypothetical protein